MRPGSPSILGQFVDETVLVDLGGAVRAHLGGGQGTPAAIV
jgi:hypothetical protein